MSESELRQRARRAISQNEKNDRKDAILFAADELLREQNIPAFTMDVLSTRLDIARATLYRYFTTKEEILLALWEQKSTRWVDSLLESLNKEMSDEEFLSCFYEESFRDPLYLQLRSLLETVIILNVSDDVLAASRSRTLRRISALSDHCSKCLSINENEGLHLIVALGALILGGLQVQSNPIRDTETMTVQVARQKSAQSLDVLFFRNAKFILEGIRRAR